MEAAFRVTFSKRLSKTSSSEKRHWRYTVGWGSLGAVIQLPKKTRYYLIQDGLQYLKSQRKPSKCLKRDRFSVKREHTNAISKLCLFNYTVKFLTSPSISLFQSKNGQKASRRGKQRKLTKSHTLAGLTHCRLPILRQVYSNDAPSVYIHILFFICSLPK